MKPSEVGGTYLLLKLVVSRTIEFVVNSYYYNYFRIFAREFFMSALSLFPTNSLGIPW